MYSIIVQVILVYNHMPGEIYVILDELSLFLKFIFLGDIDHLKDVGRRHSAFLKKI